MRETLDDKTWDVLLARIEKGRCTPFLGAGACHGALPLGSDVAMRWSEEYHYPFSDPGNLIEVAQFLAVQYDPVFPKEKILNDFAKAKPPDFTVPDEPHGLLADLPLPIYLTTNFDDFMVQALKRRKRDVRRELCRWNESLESEPSVFDDDFMPTVANPVVFHLHGHTLPESLVLTEDDYLNFLANIARNPKLLPSPIEKALDRSTCLFIGYRLADWNFRVLFQGLRPRLNFMNVAVLKPSDDSELAIRQREYLNRYYANMDLKVYWGTAREFAAELRERWNKFGAG
ncbi:MAG: SIR2 family protein [Verrucomicrobia bacterium]|nr:SIR2 family protein [Verrucomicrobiota bacterium]